MLATLTELGRASTSRRKSPTVLPVAVPGTDAPCRVDSASLRVGSCDEPSCPTITVVTPWRITDSTRGSLNIVPSACEWMSMKPGATASPRASITSAASSPSRPPIATMRPAESATSASTPGAPVPSNTVPFRMSTS